MAKLMQTVFLDLPTVCSLLQGRSAVIVADVRLSGSPLKARGSVFLRADPTAQVAGAIIESGDGGRLLYSGEAALNILSTVAAWSVYFTPSVEQPLQDYMRRLGVQAEADEKKAVESASPPPGGGGSPLRRLQPTIPDSVLNVLTIKDRLVLKTVWSMVNDQRSLSEVQALLRLPPSVVADAIESLRLFQVLE